MENNIQIFEGKKIRSVWDNEKEEFRKLNIGKIIKNHAKALNIWYNSNVY